MQVFYVELIFIWVSNFFAHMTHRYTHNPFLNFQLASIQCDCPLPRYGATAFHYTSGKKQQKRISVKWWRIYKHSQYCRRYYGQRWIENAVAVRLFPPTMCVYTTYSCSRRRVVCGVVMILRQLRFCIGRVEDPPLLFPTPVQHG